MRRMCGIGAILDPAGRTGERAAAGMVEALRHRGPDGQASRRLGPATLAHTRLAIIDVAGGDQPLVSEDGAVTADRQRRDLQPRASCAPSSSGAATASPPRSDSEVIVHGYEEHGPDCVRAAQRHLRLRALGRPRSRRLVAARDQFGVKPLYWWSDGRRLARRLRGRRPARRRAGPPGGRPRRARPLPGLPLRARPADAVRGRQQAAAGVGARRRGGRPAAGHELPRGAGRAARRRGDDELADELAERFTDAVERQMMSDVPYGAFLVGGVDSAARRGRDGPRRPGTPPTTFTIGFPGHGDAARRARARRRERPR